MTPRARRLASMRGARRRNRLPRVSTVRGLLGEDAADHRNDGVISMMSSSRPTTVSFLRTAGFFRRTTSPSRRRALTRDPQQQALKDWGASRTVRSRCSASASLSGRGGTRLGRALRAFLWLLLLRGARTTPSDRASDTTRLPQLVENSQPEIIRRARWLILHTIVANSMFVTCDPSLASIERWARRYGRKTLKASLSGRDCVRARLLLHVSRGVARIYSDSDRLSTSYPIHFRKASTCRGRTVLLQPDDRLLRLLATLLIAVRDRPVLGATEELLRQYGDRLSDDLLKRQRSAGDVTAGSTRCVEVALSG